MKIIHQRFGPLYSEHERHIWGSTNRTGHGGCWINDHDCGRPDCIMAELSGEPAEVEAKETKLTNGRESC